MRSKHKRLAALVFLMVVMSTFLYGIKMVDSAAQSLVTFFSVTFGFYMTAIAILYNATYTKILHEQIDPKVQKRGTHILRSYLFTSGYCSIFSITILIFFMTVAESDMHGVLWIEVDRLTPPPLSWINEVVDLTRLISSFLFGVSALNIFYMLLLLRFVINGMVEEAKN